MRGKTMSETLEEKYKYMCKLSEDMAVKLHKASERIDEVEKEKYQLHVDLNGVEDLCSDMQRDIFELHRENTLLKDYIDNMCAMIEYQVPVKEHDKWLEDCIELGFYKKEDVIDAEFEEVEEEK